MISQWIRAIENNLTAVMITSIMAGLFIPQFAALPDSLLLFCLGGIIFFSCQNVKLDEIKGIPLKATIVFYIVRFLILPIALFYIASLILPEYKTGILLLALVPAATAAGAFTALLQGNVALSLGVVIFSGLIAPFTIPSIMAILGYETHEIDLWGMFFTAAQVVFIPVAAWFFLARRIKTVKEASIEYGRALSVIFIFFIIAIALAKQQDYIFADPLNVLLNLVVLSGVFTVLFIFGWLWPHGGDHKIRIANAINSGVMNNALGLSLALLYFPAPVILFLALSEIPWSASLPVFKFFLSRQPQK